MAWVRYFVLVAAASSALPEYWNVNALPPAGWSDQVSVAERKELRDEVLEAFHHAYGSYIEHAYPADELMPLSCGGRGWKRRTRGTIDDALGGYALTMVDSLDMHAVVGDGEGFREATATLLRDFQSGVLTFDRDVVVSVFEASIRVLGGLLSAHQIATELGPSGRLGPPGWYAGELLPLAHDLGNRLLPAFDTPLGIPVHRVNLRKGIPRGETQDTCSAAAGTFLVEFGALSRLTGDPSFEAAARRAVAALWERRSSLGLVGGGVNGSTGRWDSRTASIGAGTDSFYEYLDKSARLFDDAEMAAMFREAYAGVEEHLAWETDDGSWWHVEVDMWKGNRRNPVNYRVSSLQAFWPAVQAGAGNLEEAEGAYDALLGLWKVYGALPDFYDVLSDSLLHYGRDSPLRPEMAESTLALYRATGSTKYLLAGKNLLRALQDISRVDCGYASVGDVKSLRLDDRMDSFFIAETLKYLFLLFDSSLPSAESQSIFCTPEQEDEVARHHARRTAAANTTANECAAATSPNNTASESGEASAFSSVDGGSGGTGGGLAPSVPISGGGSAAGGGDGERGVLDGDDGEDGGGGGSGFRGGGGGAGVGVGETGPRKPSSPSPAYAPQCLLWADTVLSTEGHPFLASILASERTGAAAATAAAAASAAQGCERGSFGDGIPVEPDHLVRGDGDLRATGELVAGCSSCSSRPSPARSEEHHGAPPSCSCHSSLPSSAAAPASSSEQAPPSAAAAAAAAAAGISAGAAKSLEAILERVSGAHGVSRNGQRRRGTERSTAKATTSTTTTPLHAGLGEVDGDGRGVGGGLPSISRLSLFDPGHHYSRAVRSEGFASRPKFAELEVMCSHPSTGSPRCNISAAGPEARAFMTRAVGEQDWAKAAQRVADWVGDTVFYEDAGTPQSEGEEDEGDETKGTDRGSKGDGRDSVYRLHQISPTAAVVVEAVAAKARARAAAAMVTEAAAADLV